MLHETEIVVVLREVGGRLELERSRMFPESTSVQLAKDSSQLVHGCRDQATVIEIDLHSFSVTSLALSPVQLTHFLSKYYNAVTTIIYKRNGMVLSTHRCNKALLIYVTCDGF
jgi:class 3 adenylate cyclase